MNVATVETFKDRVDIVIVKATKTIVCIESRRFTDPKRTGNRRAKATGVEARLGMNVSRGGNGDLLGGRQGR